MASQKHNRFGFLPGGSSRKKEKGGDILNKAPNQPSAASIAAEPSATQAHASTSKQSTTKGTRGVLGGLFSRTKTPSTRPTTPVPIAAIHTTEQQHLRDEVTDTPGAGKLTSKQAETLPEAVTATNKKKVLVLELGIGAIDLLSEVSKIAGLVLPNPVEEVLGKVTKVLGTLKVRTTETDKILHGLSKRLANDGKRGCLEGTGQNP
jgi:hypothetical protein